MKDFEKKERKIKMYEKILTHTILFGCVSGIIFTERQNTVISYILCIKKKKMIIYSKYLL